MSEELLNIVKELSEKPTTELALQFMELTADNIIKDKEIDRLNNIIDGLEKWCNECIDNHIIARENGDTTISDTFFEIVLDKIKALKENK